MKFALLFALVAATAVISHSAPIILDAAVTNVGTAQLDDAQFPDADESNLGGLIDQVSAQSADNVQDVQIETSDAKKEDIGTKHEEIHKTNGIIDLIDAMLSKVVEASAKYSVKKGEAEANLKKEKAAYVSSQSAVAIATDEYLSSSAQAEKEKAMIYKIRSMVINLNGGNGGKGLNIYPSCRDAKAADSGAKSGVYDLLVNDKPLKAYCDMTTAGGGWTLAMRTQASGDSFNYESRHWSTDSVLNEINLANGGFDSSEAKFTAFNVIPSSEILIKTSSGKNTQLGMSRVSTLLDLFKGPTTRLDVISGEASPQKLMSGGSSTVCGAAWRTNSKGSYNFKIRIGGFFSHSWGCNYGNDSTDSPTGAEEAGLGLWDEQWAPLRPSGRSAGVRQAHNYNTAPGGGQDSVASTVWVR